jgi:uncharacterized SAM-binding protein YcdF (DUF218 family)
MPIDIDPTLALTLKSFVWHVLVPPNLFITLAAVLALLMFFRGRRRGRAGTMLMLLCFIAFYLSVFPPGSRALMTYVEKDAGVALDEAKALELMTGNNKPQALVILGGGAVADAREKPDESNLSPMALERAVAGARIARWTRLPVLTTGGKLRESTQSEADIMARVLRKDLLVAVRWTESGSFDTADNASMTAQILNKENIKHILLVTHAFHMPRATAAFEAQGFTVTKAPIGFMASQGQPIWTYWIPHSLSRQRASWAYHELAGALWYHLRRTYLKPLTE